MSSPDFDRAATYRAFALQVKRAAETGYFVSAMTMTEGNCVATHAHYDLQVSPWIDDMAVLAPDLDALIAMHDSATPNHAAAACLQSALLVELEGHEATACMGPLLQDSRAEAYRHIEAMFGLTNQAITLMDDVLDGIESQAKGDWPWSLPRPCP